MSKNKESRVFAVVQKIGRSFLHKLHETGTWIFASVKAVPPIILLHMKMENVIIES